LNGPAGPGELVQRHPALLDGAERGRRLQDLALKPPQGRFEIGARDRRGAGVLHDGPGAVIGVALGAEAQKGPVGLARVHEVFDDAGGASQADRQDAGGEGVERAGVADLLLAGAAAHEGDDVERSPAFGLVDVEDAVSAQAFPLATSSSCTLLSRDRTSAPRAIEVSSLKLRNGTLRMSMRFLSSRCMKPLAASRAFMACFCSSGSPMTLTKTRALARSGM